MPLYEYRCEACGAKEEKLQSLSAPTLHDCPKCGLAEAMHREISRTAFVLSGSGWYAGGYSATGKPPVEGSEGHKTASGSQTDGAPAKTAPAAKTESGEASEAKSACASGCACHSPTIEVNPKPS